MSGTIGHVPISKLLVEEKKLRRHKEGRTGAAAKHSVLRNGIESYIFHCGINIKNQVVMDEISNNAKSKKARSRIVCWGLTTQLHHVTCIVQIKIAEHHNHFRYQLQSQSVSP